MSRYTADQMKSSKLLPLFDRRRFFLFLAAAVATANPCQLTLAQNGVEEAGIDVDIAIVLGRQALSFAVGSIAESAFGKPKISDVRTWVQEAVVEIERYVGGLIAQNEIDHIVAAADQIGQNLSEYSGISKNNRARNAWLVRDADLRTTELLDLSIKFDQTFTVLLAAMSYRLIARQALFNLDREAAHILSIKGQVDHFFHAATTAFERIRGTLAPSKRIGACCIHEMISPWWTCRPAVDADIIGDDNQMFASNYTEMLAVNPVAQIARNRSYNRVNGVFQKFQKDTRHALVSIGRAYAAMCDHVGEIYALPVAIPSVLSEPNPAPRIWISKDSWKTCL